MLHHPIFHFILLLMFYLKYLCLAVAIYILQTCYQFCLIFAQHYIKLMKQNNQLKQIKLKLQKVHNWTSTQSTTHIEFTFYSKQSQHLITTKQMECIPQNNQLTIGILLKICYPPQENIVVIAIRQNAPHYVDFGELELDLEGLRITKSKYIAFGGFEKILQVCVGDGKQIYADGNKEITLEQRRVKNTEFIAERKKFLQQYIHKQEQLRTKFEERISSIIKNEKYRKYNPRIRHQHDQQYQQNQTLEYDDCEPQNEVFKSEINKRHLQQLIITRSAFYDKKGMIPSTSTHIDPGLVKGATSPRRHKLILNTLNIVEKQGSKQ